MKSSTIIVCDEENKHQFFDLLKELRIDLSYSEFVSIYREAKANDQYGLMGVYGEEGLVALIGYRILFDFLHGKHLYVDDLVTQAGVRSMGYGAKLLCLVEEKAKALGCSRLRLNAGMDNEMGHKFYSKNGWIQKAVAYKKRI